MIQGLAGHSLGMSHKKMGFFGFGFRNKVLLAFLKIRSWPQSSPVCPLISEWVKSCTCLWHQTLCQLFCCSQIQAGKITFALESSSWGDFWNTNSRKTGIKRKKNQPKVLLGLFQSSPSWDSLQQFLPSKLSLNIHPSLQQVFKFGQERWNLSYLKMVFKSKKAELSFI